MISRTTMIGLGLAPLAGLAAYAATVAVRPAPVSPTTVEASRATEMLLDWLQATPAQRAELRRHDPAFADELPRLRAELAARRHSLATVLEDPGTPDEEIMARVEAVLEARNTLERRVARYLLAVREHLTPDQQQRLFSLCAESVRRGPGWRWRQDRPETGRGPGAGPGGMRRGAPNGAGARHTSPLDAP
jgi:Spy/CpxP family protein refolding chaperone